MVMDAPPPRPIEIALVQESRRPHLESEIQPLLRKRLLLIFAICAGATAIFAVPSFVLAAVWETDVLGTHWLDGVSVALWAVLVAILWNKRALPLRQLRTLELVGFGGLAFVYGWWTYQGCRSETLHRFASLGDEGMVTLASTPSLMWFSLIVIYGMYVPNTWRRCAAVVGCMALLPFAIGAMAGLGAESFDGGLRATYLLFLGYWMAFGALAAIYGSHKISQLRQEAFEARQLGQYRLKQRLGAGGMGEVYLAEHLLLRRPCAIKLIRPERAGDPNNLRRFEREVQVTATLTHPNTVQIFDYGHAEDGTFYYAMEYLPGLSLSELVHQHGPLPPERAVHFLRQVCGALSEAHAIGLIHRDIKPGNIMVCERGGMYDVAKLLDFGLVRAPARIAGEETLTQEGTIAGTPTYMSPEQASGRGDLDPRSDIYSLGAVAYFLLTGQPPFAGRSAVEVVAAHLYEPPQPIARHRFDVPAELEAVILKCLSKDPDQRFPDAASLERALTACPAAGLWTQERAAAWWQEVAGTLRVP
jgi:serine/threonine-protein kinase